MSLIDLDNAKISYVAMGDIYEYPPMVFLHGIMGSKKNLEHFVGKLLSVLPNSSALLFDLRNHGQSSKHCPPFTVLACADDIALAIKKLDCLKPSWVFGHSFGGKVALLVAKKLPFVKQVWLLDCPPGQIHQSSGQTNFSALAVLLKLKEVSWPVRSRNDLVNELLNLGVAREIALWMTTNLRQEDDGLYLTFDPDDILKMLNNFISLDLWPLVHSLSKRCEIHLVAAEFARRVTLEDKVKLMSLSEPKMGFFHLLKNSGHFVHKDNPNDLIQMIKDFC